MPIAYITRRERFSSAHRLFKSELDDSGNYELYGKCSHSNWHGHNYELFVTVKGEVDAETGYVANLKTISNLIKNEIIEKLDHKNLNLDVDFLKGVIPTTENLAIAIWQCLEPKINMLGASLYKVKVQETENNFVEYLGE